MRIKLFHLFFIFHCVLAFSQNDAVFPAPEIPFTIYGKATTGIIVIDGELNETDWKTATPVSKFLQVEPFQTQKPKYKTIVKILYDKKYLYISAFCKDSLGKKGVRVQDFRRDFGYFDNDLFGVSLDPFNGKRNATSFQTNPYGALRDLQVFDDIIFDRDWDALWKSRSTITDEGWSCEMAIPWKTLRYPKYQNEEVVWGINFLRIARRDNETSAFPNYPRSFDAYRMNYAAEIKGIEPPKPSTNIQVNPYLVTQFGSQSGTDLPRQNNSETKIGGEIKYSPTASSTIDLTFNTDFAQADADRQVNNLTRFSIFFPERRQFFLENAGLFEAGNQNTYTPFFSRTIGLDNDGNPIPINGGIRFTDKNTKYSIGALYVHQQEQGLVQAASSSVLRFIKNYGTQNNIGILVTNKINETSGNLRESVNSTATITGFNRFTDKLSLDYTLSGSKTNGGVQDEGYASTTSLNYNANDLVWVWNTGIISKSYNPALGFIIRNDFVKNFIDIYLNKRKLKWFPKFVRSWEPGINADFFQNIDNLNLQEGYLGIYPVFFAFNDGSVITSTYQLHWQNLIQNFNPLGLEIEAGSYNYQSVNISYRSDQSKKLSWTTNFTAGGFFNGKITTYSGSIRYAPAPHFATNISYEENQLRDLGRNNENLTTRLITPNIRMALNARVQMNVFYQYNTVNERSRWNARFSWEYQPLSYIYLVFNENRTTDFRQDQTIAKISFLKQF